jgi:hypothetical protein
MPAMETVWYLLLLLISLNLAVPCTSDYQFVYSGFTGANFTLTVLQQ